MIAILKQSASDEAVGHIVSWIEKKGLKTDVSRGENETIIGLVGDTTKIDRLARVHGCRRARAARLRAL